MAEACIKVTLDAKPLENAFAVLGWIKDNLDISAVDVKLPTDCAGYADYIDIGQDMKAGNGKMDFVVKPNAKMLAIISKLIVGR